jgi:uncharacterized protein (TIGR03435 family)
MNSRALAAAVALVFPLVVHAQPPRPSFEVASIKRNVSGAQNSGNRTLPGGRITINNQRLRQIIRSAYGSSDLEVVGGPDWIDGDRWDITAVGGAGDRDAAWRLMLQTLLADRFKLRAHVEQRERPVYGLVFARSDRQLGPDIHTTTCKDDSVCATTQVNTTGITAGTITGVSRTMTDIGRSLSPYAERRVIDRTGLDGRYDFEVRWSEDVSIFTALPEQLGLKLEPQRAPVDVVVVDSAERAIED